MWYLSITYLYSFILVTIFYLGSCTSVIQDIRFSYLWNLFSVIMLRLESSLST